jgi:hypothetical protein
MWQKTVHEFHHYKAGFQARPLRHWPEPSCGTLSRLGPQLLWADTKISFRLLKKSVSGTQLTRRERRQVHVRVWGCGQPEPLP